MHVDAKDVFEEFDKRAYNETTKLAANEDAQVLATLILADRMDAILQELRKSLRPIARQNA